MNPSLASRHRRGHSSQGQWSGSRLVGKGPWTPLVEVFRRRAANNSIPLVPINIPWTPRVDRPVASGERSIRSPWTLTQ